MKKNKNRRPIKSKESKAIRNMRKDVWRDLKESPFCPYCGGKMTVRPANEIIKGREGLLYVCENHPVCDCYCRVNKTENGSMHLISTPANRNLRALRSEAHYYLDKIVEAGIFKKNMDVYHYMNSRHDFIGNHIGNLREYGCIQFICGCIEILYQNKSKVKNFQPYFSKTKLPEETKKYLCELKKL